MTNAFHPASLFIAGAILLPFLRARAARAFLVVALPVLGFLNLLTLQTGSHWVFPFLEYEIIFGQVDTLSLLFAYIFHIITFIAAIYALPINKRFEYSAGFLYAGSALGVIFAGDFFSFYAFWELLGLAAVFLILQNKTRDSLRAGLRYLLVHVAGGLVLLAGILIHAQSTGSIAVEAIELSGLGSYLIFIGFGVCAAWPFLHAWLPDAYPRASIVGAVFLSAFTTKTAVYALARVFPGAEPLIWIGATMTAFPIFFAVIENDLRRVLSYSLINQVGFMVVGIGIGTELALNGTAAHVFTHILYKALLFMSIGAVMYRTGTAKVTELGGLYKSMPITCICCIIAAASISAFPLFSGFVSKSLVISAAADGHMIFIWFVLLFASAGVCHHAGIKVPFYAFFSHDAGHKVKEAPKPMLIAMGIAAVLCIVIGCFPDYTIYPLLPYTTTYEPYTSQHIVGQLQLLLFAALAFILIILSGYAPDEVSSTNLDADWFYRMGSRYGLTGVARTLNTMNDICSVFFVERMASSIRDFLTNAPARLTSRILKPIWTLRGMSPTQQTQMSATLNTNFAAGAFPIGITCALGVLMVALLYLL